MKLLDEDNHYIAELIHEVQQPITHYLISRVVEYLPKTTLYFVPIVTHGGELDIERCLLSELVLPKSILEKPPSSDEDYIMSSNLEISLTELLIVIEDKDFYNNFQDLTPDFKNRVESIMLEFNNLMKKAIFYTIPFELSKEVKNI